MDSEKFKKELASLADKIKAPGAKPVSRADAKEYIINYAKLSMLKYDLETLSADNLLERRNNQIDNAFSPVEGGKNRVLDGDAEIVGLRQLQKAYSRYLKEYDDLKDKSMASDDLKDILASYCKLLSLAVKDNKYLSYDELTKLIAEKEKEALISLDEARSRKYEPDKIEEDLNNLNNWKDLKNKRRELSTTLKQKQKELEEIEIIDGKDSEAYKAKLKEIGDIQTELNGIPTLSELNTKINELTKEYELKNSKSLEMLLTEKYEEYKKLSKDKPVDSPSPKDPSGATDSKTPEAPSTPTAPKAPSTPIAPVSPSTPGESTPVASPTSEDKYFLPLSKGLDPTKYFSDKGLVAKVKGDKISYISKEYNSDGSIKGYHFIEDKPINDFLDNPIKSYEKLIDESMKDEKLWDAAGYNSKSSMREIKKKLIKEFKQEFKAGDENSSHYDTCLEKILAMCTAISPEDLKIATNGRDEKPHFYPGTKEQYQPSKVEIDKLHMFRSLFNPKLAYSLKFSTRALPSPSGSSEEEAKEIDKKAGLGSLREEIDSGKDARGGETFTPTTPTEKTGTEEKSEEAEH